jgi:hypothetical protein
VNIYISGLVKAYICALGGVIFNIINNICLKMQEA